MSGGAVRPLVCGCSRKEGEPAIAGMCTTHAAAKSMLKALRAVLIFHSGRPWYELQKPWEGLTGNAEPTTKGLCDLVRSAVTEAETGLPMLSKDDIKAMGDAYWS